MLRKTPGSSSAKTPSLASARRMRWRVSASARFSSASSATERGPPARASATPRSAATPSVFVPNAPRMRFQSRASGGRSLIARAASTATATSSASAFVSVRQSSSVLPSRTTAITGGSPARNFTASSSSTAQAKLGSSVNGSDPPPARATVSSTSPPTRLARCAARVRTASGDSRNMRRTGISSGASIASVSVPSRAASVSLSARNARCSGWRRSFSTRSARPTMMPACGPPSSLSPEKQTRSAPAARLARAVGSSPMSMSAPEPRSSTSGRP